jgi:hypothetical protein
LSRNGGTTFSPILGIGQTFDLDVSRDGGVSWSRIAVVITTAATTGAYQWNVTGPPTSRGRIRASWPKGVAVADMSDVDFMIPPRVDVKAFSTAVTWGAGSTRTMTWTHNLAASERVNIDFTPDDGLSWVPVGVSVPNATATTGTCTGAMPAIITTQGRIRVAPAAFPADGDVR